MGLRQLKWALAAVSSAIVFSACGSSGGGGGGVTEKPVLPYCSTVETFSGGITVSGRALYEYRENGNGNIGTPNPIRHAEIRVVDSAGTIIQCGTTDANGDFAVDLQGDGSTVTLQVSSRSDNTFAQAYVLNNPTDNSFYTLDYEMAPTSTVNIGNITASASGTSILGGAFNILDKIHDANDYLRAETAGCGATYNDCQEISTPPLVTIYWTPGFNPGSYFGITSGLSFYLPDDRELYILGGIAGDTANSDTDHFDSSIILHEYGHFLEDVYSITDSPGGAHSGNSIIDARLAWGEGWANFFQAAVTGNPVYRDTYGTPEGSPGVFFDEDLETPENDLVTTADPGEGNFREFSITRLLWDSIDQDATDVDNDGVNGTFGEFWASLSSTSQGFKASSGIFRSVGLFHALQGAFGGATDWSALRTSEKQVNTRTHYANTLNPGGCNVNINPENISVSQIENGSFANSNQFASNDWYQYNHPGGAFQLTLTYTNTNAAAPIDLDVLVWTQEYTFGVQTDLAASSADPVTVPSAGATETINTSLAAGNYMINIHAYTGSPTGTGDGADYSLSLGSQGSVQAVCPN